MKLHPFDECVEKAKEYMGQGFAVQQQFNCAHCGTKQTIEDVNVFYTHGDCEECGKRTNMQRNGCNYMLIADF